MLINNTHLTELNSPNQTIKARVELYKGSALEKVCNCSDMLSEFTVEKTGEGKFFGFGICQKLHTVLFDIERELNITPEHTIEASFGVGSNFIYPFPNFYITEIERDEDSNQLTLTAYDALYKATNHTVSELNLTAPYTIKAFILACGALLNIPVHIDESLNESFSLAFESGANFDGTENIRAALNAAAEATQTIYYIDSNWEMVFKRLDKSGSPVLTIHKTEYIELINAGACVLGNITHTTELGDNVSSITSGPESGVTQYIRDNPFWELREDIGTLLDKAQASVGGTSINQFECTWMGNYLLEIGDKIALIAEDDSVITSYVLDDTVIFDGTLLQTTRWAYDENAAETADNPTSLGDALNKTFARVDKVNKRIDLVVSEGTELDGKIKINTDSIAALQINSKSITASVQSIETTTKEQINSLNDSVEKLTKKSELAITEDQVKITIDSELSKGVDKVNLSTGFTFDENGLSITKLDNEVNTLISNDGMKVFRQNEDDPVLVVNNAGVNAENLHATTYLLIGKNSRFEDYNNNTRTGCFWIGG